MIGAVIRGTICSVPSGDVKHSGTESTVELDEWTHKGDASGVYPLSTG